MHCNSCGAALATGTRFCSSCGAPAAAPALPPGAVLQMSAQGIDRTLRANGDHGSLEFGPVTAEYVLGVFNYLLPQRPPPGDDACPMGVFLKGPGGEVGFMIDEGRIRGVDSDEAYAPEEAVMKVLGTLQRAPQRKQGWMPIRHPQIPPTDLDRVEPRLINTGPSSPQVSTQVWGDLGRGGFYLSLPFFLIGLVVTALLISEDKKGPAFGVGCGAALFAFLMHLSWTKGRTTYRLGVDWATNTLWVESGGKVQYLPDATCIHGFALETFTSSKVRLTHGFMLRRTQSTSHQLQAIRSSGKPATVPSLGWMQGGDARNALEAANALLRMLG